MNIRKLWCKLTKHRERKLYKREREEAFRAGEEHPFRIRVCTFCGNRRKVPGRERRVAE